MKSLISFLFSRAFLKNLLLAFILGVAIILLALKATDYYTHHGERIAVPNLKGKTIDEAEELLADNNLTYVIQDSVFNHTAKPGSVIDQFPRSGQEVKRKRVLKLTIAALAPQKVVVEQVKDLSLRQAIGQLSKKGIVVERLKYVESLYSNLVLGILHNENRVAEGEELYKGEKVVLEVGKKAEDSIIVPDLEGLSEKYAIRKALEEGLNIGKITFSDNSEEGRRKARVQHQSVTMGDTIALGEEIDLILAEPKNIN